MPERKNRLDVPDRIAAAYGVDGQDGGDIARRVEHLRDDPKFRKLQAQSILLSYGVTLEDGESWSVQEVALTGALNIGALYSRVSFGSIGDRVIILHRYKSHQSGTIHQDMVVVDGKAEDLPNNHANHSNVNYSQKKIILDYDPHRYS